jgi:hypothetical protein
MMWFPGCPLCDFSRSPTLRNIRKKEKPGSIPIVSRCQSIAGQHTNNQDIPVFTLIADFIDVKINIVDPSLIIQFNSV